MSIKGKLIVIGGSVDKGNYTDHPTDIPKKLMFSERGILKRMLSESTYGDLSRIEVITTASNIPEEIGAEYISAFERLNAFNVSVMNIKTREESNSPEYLERLKLADIVLFTGGDLLRLTPIFGGTAF